MNEEQTASLKTALLHGHSGLVCGPRCEPLSGVSIPIPWTSTIRATQGWSSLPAAGLACHFELAACAHMLRLPIVCRDEALCLPPTRVARRSYGFANQPPSP